jgi:hypothetical protein
MGLGLVVGHDLIDGAAAGSSGIKDLVQEGQEGEPGGVEALALSGIGAQERGSNARGAEGFQMVEGLAAEAAGGFAEEGVKTAEERCGGKHIYLPIYRYFTLTVKPFTGHTAPDDNPISRSVGNATPGL